MIEIIGLVIVIWALGNLGKIKDFIKSVLSANVAYYEQAALAIEAAASQIWDRRGRILIGALAINVLATGLIIMGVFVESMILGRVLISIGGFIVFLFWIFIYLSVQGMAFILESLLRIAGKNINIWLGVFVGLAKKLNVLTEGPEGVLLVDRDKFVNKVKGMKPFIIAITGMILILVVFPHWIALAVVSPTLFVITVATFMATAWSDVIDLRPARRFTYKLVTFAIPIIVVSTLLTAASSVALMFFPKTYNEVYSYLPKIDNYLGGKNTFEKIDQAKSYSIVISNVDLVVFDKSTKKPKTDTKVPAGTPVIFNGISPQEYEDGDTLITTLASDGIQMLVDFHKFDDDGSFVPGGLIKPGPHFKLITEEEALIRLSGYSNEKENKQATRMFTLKKGVFEVLNITGQNPLPLISYHFSADDTRRLYGTNNLKDVPQKHVPESINNLRIKLNMDANGTITINNVAKKHWEDGNLRIWQNGIEILN